jgi:hypothetical protein
MFGQQMRMDINNFEFIYQLKKKTEKTRSYFWA